MTVFTNVSGELHRWLSEKGINPPTVVLSFDTERDAELAAFHAQREFDDLNGRVSPDSLTGRNRIFVAHGVEFKIAVRPKVV